ncbi:MAG: DUF58 domain-containing protein [Bacteroidia bacterium]|nr:DUF58 domain-containing protein [Bacteroidia bacterium]NND24749.1 DUF58 domain-containing protein [Flavobacteriaceae bacterium]MBT8277844.1 DUF58 domain-containing protein [Bacteroidia bacterium]NNK59072.1 DUF58 domain-containing protein [Flavobacteriaceae bacterium]NNL32501.1 DUF58 domain-containing protein [Flavobacteriaceae bacterium]
MQKNYHQLLKPEVINSVSGLALIAKIIVDGFLTGVNHSRRVGSGMEFSQFRAYEPGDDLRLLDWKMLARSGRYYIKQSEIETNVSIKFILDSSKSMVYKEDGLSKMELAKILIASLGYLAQKQGDAIGLFALNDQHLHSIYPKVHKQHFNRLLLELVNIENIGQWPQNKNVSNMLHDRTHKEMVFFITDLYEYDQELTQFIKRLKTLRNEVVVLHLMGEKEITFDYKETLTFEDLETGKRLKVDPKEMKKAYITELNAMIENVKTFLLSNDINYHLFKLHEPIGEALKVFMQKRSKLM